MTHAERLHWVERRLRTISAEQHALAREKADLVTEATRLRCSFTVDDAAHYMSVQPADECVYLRRLQGDPV